MKLIYAGIAIAFTKTAHAGLALIEEALNSAGGAADRNRTGLRSFGTLADFSISTIKDGWGCWCFFDDDSYQGKGPPLNEVDAMCKVLQQGYECFEMDDGGTCTDPWDVVYAPIALTNVVGDEYADLCQANNPRNNCARRACIIESRFAKEILEYVDEHGTAGFATENLHSDSAWDQRAKCPIRVSAQNANNQKECCGDYPYRFPFKQTGDRGCCNGVTFDNGLFKCCPDFSIELVCPLD